MERTDEATDALKPLLDFAREHLEDDELQAFMDAYSVALENVARKLRDH